jgi:hypothetical protein
MSVSIKTESAYAILNIISTMLQYFEKKHSISTISNDFINNLVIYRLNAKIGDILLYEMLHCYLIDYSNMSWKQFLLHWNGLKMKQVHKLYEVELNKFMAYCDGVEYDPSDYDDCTDYEGADANDTMATVIKRFQKTFARNNIN